MTWATRRCEPKAIGLRKQRKYRAVAVFVTTMISPGDDDAFHRRRNRPKVMIVLRADGVHRFSEKFRIGRSIGKEVDDLQCAVPPGFCETDTAAYRRVIALSIRSAGVQHHKADRGQGNLPASRQTVAIHSRVFQNGGTLHPRNSTTIRDHLQ